MKYDFNMADLNGWIKCTFLDMETTGCGSLSDTHFRHRTEFTVQIPTCKLTWKWSTCRHDKLETLLVWLWPLKHSVNMIQKDTFNNGMSLLSQSPAWMWQNYPINMDGLHYTDIHASYCQYFKYVPFKQFEHVMIMVSLDLLIAGSVYIRRSPKRWHIWKVRVSLGLSSLSQRLNGGGQSSVEQQQGKLLNARFVWRSSWNWWTCS